METLDFMSREQLYDAVWTTPVMRLSKKYGLSDVGLAKLCKRYQIPRPGVGYWAKLKSGFPEPRTPLPPVNDPKLETISLTELPPATEVEEPRYAVDDEVNALIKSEMESPAIHVAASLRSPHALVAAAMADDLIRSAEANAAEGPRGWVGVVRAEREVVARANIEVSRALRSRAYRVMDALLNAATERGTKCGGKPDQHHRSTFIKVLGETFELRMYEPNLQKAHLLTKEEQARKEKYGSVYAPKHDYVRSEKLCLQLREGSYTVHWEGRDGQKARIEDRLNRVFIAALREVDEARKWKRKRELEAAAQREAEQRRLAEEEQRRREEEARKHDQARVQGLLNEADNWRKSRQLRAYLRAVRRVIAEQGRTVTPGSDLELRLQWADGVANQLDPLLPPRPSPGPAGPTGVS